MAPDKWVSSEPADADEESSFSSPPCFMHEIRPEYLGYMSEDEAGEVLAEVRALRAEAAAVGCRAEADIARRCLRGKLRECLPRIYPSAVRDEIEELLRRIEDEWSQEQTDGERT